MTMRFVKNRFYLSMKRSTHYTTGDLLFYRSVRQVISIVFCSRGKRRISYSRDFWDFYGTPGIFGISIVLPGFLGFLWDFWDFHGIFGIFMGFLGFPWDFRDFHRTPNPYLYYILYLSLFIEDVQNIFATLLCAMSTVSLHVYSKKIRVCLFNTERSTRKTWILSKSLKLIFMLVTWQMLTIFHIFMLYFRRTQPPDAWSTSKYRKNLFVFNLLMILIDRQERVAITNMACFGC
jgi:hypothetical protein